MLNGVFSLVAVAEMIWMFIIQSRGHGIKNEEFRRYLNPNFKFANGEVSPLTPASRDVTDYPSPSVPLNYPGPSVPMNYPGPSVPMKESIKIKMKETRLSLRKSQEYEEGDEVAMVLRDLWINQEDKTNGYKLTELDLGFTN